MQFRRETTIFPISEHFWRLQTDNFVVFMYNSSGS